MTQAAIGIPDAGCWLEIMIFSYIIDFKLVIKHFQSFYSKNPDANKVQSFPCLFFHF